MIRLQAGGARVAEAKSHDDRGREVERRFVRRAFVEGFGGHGSHNIMQGDGRPGGDQRYEEPARQAGSPRAVRSPGIARPAPAALSQVINRKP